MKLKSVLVSLGFLSVLPLLSAADAPSFISETPREFFSSGDFDGDGRTDVVIVDKQTGKYRIGYQLTDDALTWVDCRYSSLKGLSGFTIGRVIDPKLPGLAFASAEGNLVTAASASNPNTAAKPVNIPFSAALGPSVVGAVHVGPVGGLDDLFVGSIYNSPDPNQGTFVKNDGSAFATIAEEVLTGVPTRVNQVSLAPGKPNSLCLLLNGDKGVTLTTEDLSGGKPVAGIKLEGLPAGSDYVFGHFRGSPSPELILYKPGESKITVRPLEASASGAPTVGAAKDFDLGAPVRGLVVLDPDKGRRLLAIFGQGEKAGIFNFDAAKAPELLDTLMATNEYFTGAAGLPKGLIIFAQMAADKSSIHYHVWSEAGNKYAGGPFGSLPSLADNDNVTIPDIHDRVVSKLDVKDAAGMRPYTNTIPGTPITFAMVPIPGGEYVMGSPDSEKGHKADEAPQHKVKIDPFWMGACEVTWNEYELFMYPDEEKRLRETSPTDKEGDKLADAVTHPSHPYVEMSFGMGKDYFPAICMTHHAANKYCQWLSAKTGQFYRLPTEAEWEYAARAGTTNAYFFGNDSKELPKYAWFEENSDFKYQKVGKKQASPWGLYDIYGNVTEWVLDQYDPDWYKKEAALGTVTEPWNKATKPYPHAVKGGSWDDDAASCRSAARRGSERAWKMTDPQLPKSIWFLSDAQWVGFRVIRPLKVPPPEEMQKYWSSGTERD